MGFVNHHEAHRATLKKIAQSPFQRFGSEVHELVLAATKGGQSAPSLLVIQAGIDLSCSEAELPELVHLILHEADQRRDHEHGAFEETGRQLKRERFSCTSGHDRYAVPALHHGFDDLTLARTETVVPEGVPERLDETVGRQG